MTGGNIILENNLFCNLVEELKIYKKCTYLYIDKHMIRSISSTNDNIKNKKISLVITDNKALDMYKSLYDTDVDSVLSYNYNMNVLSESANILESDMEIIIGIIYKITTDYNTLNKRYLDSIYKNLILDFNKQSKYIEIISYEDFEKNNINVNRRFIYYTNQNRQGKNNYSICIPVVYKFKTFEGLFIDQNDDITLGKLKKENLLDKYKIYGNISDETNLINFYVAEIEIAKLLNDKTNPIFDSMDTNINKFTLKNNIVSVPCRKDTGIYSRRIFISDLYVPYIDIVLVDCFLKAHLIENMQNSKNLELLIESFVKLLNDPYGKINLTILSKQNFQKIDNTTDKIITTTIETIQKPNKKSQIKSNPIVDHKISKHEKKENITLKRINKASGQ